jgi:hypothetical protein
MRNRKNTHPSHKHAKPTTAQSPAMRAFVGCSRRSQRAIQTQNTVAPPLCSKSRCFQCRPTKRPAADWHPPHTCQAPPKCQVLPAPVLDLCCHGHECLLNVGGVLGTGLQEGDADLISKCLQADRRNCISGHCVGTPNGVLLLPSDCTMGPTDDHSVLELNTFKQL